MKKILLLILSLSFVFLSGFKNKDIDYETIEGKELMTYVGESIIYKDSSSILLKSTISDLVKDNFIMVENDSIPNMNYQLVINTDNYTGNGSIVGTHVIRYDCHINLYDDSNYVYQKTYSKDILIKVVDNLGCNYIFEDTVYIYSTHSLKKNNVTNILKYIKEIPNENLYINYDSTFFEESENEEFEKYSLDLYEINYEYQSASGLAGSGVFSIKILQSSFQDVLVKKETNLLIIILVIIATLISIIFAFKYFKKYKYGRRWR